ncbi:thiamine pyrophosphate-binding protein [Litchfieldella xinjiangensis]|uniref:thiamine pyrophosphate-binding protein n=1 Tax=Litchfieldella xinjiangensis TaxID=1166948 RepID=UPI0005BD4C25|nr:thiamine pyrophosphate-binding protein [Halomonas xinjiangensis]
MAIESSANTGRTGAQVIVDTLRINGIDRAYAVPGESYLSVLDALYEQHRHIRLVTCRHESGAANMAEAHGKLTGTPGVCFVTRGPGATHASIAIHTAYQDSSPMILFIGQVAREMREREAFQEIDYRQMFGPLAKWVTEVDDARRLPEILSRAFQTCLSGRPGPVVIALPEDMLDDIVQVTDVAQSPGLAIAPTDASMQALDDLMNQAQRPVMILGGGGWSQVAGDAIRDVAERHGIPVLASFRCQDFIDNDSPAYVGRLGLGAPAYTRSLVEEADLVIAIGARLGEATMQGYSLLTPPIPRQRLVHVHPDSRELGRVYQATLMINATSPEFAEALSELDYQPTPAHRERLQALRHTYETYSYPAYEGHGLDMQSVMSVLTGTLPSDTLYTNGAGNYTLWLQRFIRFHRFRSQVAPTSGAMGYGIPAAIAAKLAFPERQVVAFGGDGCAMMSIQELATASQESLRILFVVVNNASFGTIRMHQEKRFPGRVSGTTLTNPDFVALARACHLHAEAIENNADMAAALARCLAHDGPSLLEIRLPPDAPFTPGE